MRGLGSQAIDVATLARTYHSWRIDGTCVIDDGGGVDERVARACARAFRAARRWAIDTAARRTTDGETLCVPSERDCEARFQASLRKSRGGDGDCATPDAITDDSSRWQGDAGDEAGGPDLDANHTHAFPVGPRNAVEGRTSGHQQELQTRGLTVGPTDGRMQEQGGNGRPPGGRTFAREVRIRVPCTACGWMPPAGFYQVYDAAVPSCPNCVRLPSARRGQEFFTMHVQNFYFSFRPDGLVGGLPANDSML